MKVLSYAVVLMIASFFISCSSTNSNDDPNIEQEIVALEPLLVALEEKKNANNLLITAEQKIIQTAEIWILTFETTDSLIISKELIIDVELNTNDWQARLIIPENEPFEMPMLGNKLLYDEAYSLKINPYGNAPLTAELTLGTLVEGKIAIEVKGRGDFGVPIGKAFEGVGRSFKIPILGLYNNYKNQVEIQFFAPNGDKRLTETLEITTANYNPATVQIIKNNLASDDAAIYFSSNLKMGYDQRGQVRWIWQGDDQFLFRKLQNGNLLFTTNEDRVSYHSRYFREVTLLGEEIKKYRVPNYFHHEIKEMPNGNFLVATNSTPIVLGNGQKQEDTIVEIDRQSGEVIHTLDFSTIIDPNRLRMPGERAEDWLHNNAIYYDQENQEILISGRAQSAIINTDYPSGELNWILSSHEEWNDEFKPFLLTPVNASGNAIDVSNQDFWTYGQHAALKLPNGNILTYDNGLYRGFYKNRNAPFSTYSRAVEYKIDRELMTIQKVWEFDMDKRFFTPYTGDVDYYPETGNRLIAFMWGSADTPRVVEIDANNSILFEILMAQGHNHYRAEKIYLY